MALTIDLYVNDSTNRATSSGFQPMVPDIPLYAIPICSCPQSRNGIVKKMTKTLQKTFKEVRELLESRYGELSVVSVSRGEGSFGVAILVATKNGKHTFMIKTQKCHSCQGYTNHAEMFMKEMNAMNQIIKDKKYEFLLPYICAQYPTQPEPMWFEERAGSVIELNPSSSRDRTSLGVIVMRAMEQSLIINASTRKSYTNNTIQLGGWLSFIWGGSLLGMMGELILSGSFHGDLKEDNIVGERLNQKDPFTFCWKAIDFGGSGNASSEADFNQTMYTPHYTPIHSIPKKQVSHREYAWIHDILALAHVIRNMTSFMTSTTRNTTPYSSKDNVERFFMTPKHKLEVFTQKILREIPENHMGVKWCKEWIGLLVQTRTSWMRWNSIHWWIRMAKQWLSTCDSWSEVKPKHRIPIVSRIRTLVSLLNKMK